MDQVSNQSTISSSPKPLATTVLSSPSSSEHNIKHQNGGNPFSGLHGSILSRIFTFSHVRDVPAITSTCSSWKATLEHAYQEIYHETVKTCYPRLHQLKLLEEECLRGGSGTDAFAISTFKEILKRHLAVSFKPPGINRKLQKDLHTMFAHKGILAFSNCCGNCTDSYNDLDDTFVFREQRGIYFFKAHLNGMNYDGFIRYNVPINYGALEYIDEHWDEECIWIYGVGYLGWRMVTTLLQSLIQIPNA